MKHLLLLFLAGGSGTLARVFLANVFQKFTTSNFPLGIFLVNLLGCFAFGIVWTIAVSKNQISLSAGQILLTGFLGGFTTFSAFTFDTVQLARVGHWMMAIGNCVGQVVTGILGLLLGMALIQMLVVSK